MRIYQGDLIERNYWILISYGSSGINYKCICGVWKMKEIYIDDDKDVLLVGKPSYNYEVIHREKFYELDLEKIWVKKI